MHALRAAPVTPAPAYEFTNAWFEPHAPAWAELFDTLKPQRILEVGCYEGRATIAMIEMAARYCEPEIACIDTWAGSLDLPPTAMQGVEDRFDDNIALALTACEPNIAIEKHNKSSALALAELIAQGRRFDLIYIDGSHVACDVLTDAVLGFQLLCVGGVMVFDDYTWCMEPAGKQDPLNMPKFAVEAFATMFMRKIMVTPFGAAGGQYAIRRVSA